ncbi:MAG TPA: hypothetical protein VF292_00440 [Rhodanobacteraceae bacterium]
MHWPVALFLAIAAPAVAAPVTLPARAVHFQPEVWAWATVEPLAPLVLRATATARVLTVRVHPGEAVKPGESLVTLGGPQLNAALASARAHAHAARTQLAASERTAASAKRTYPVAINRAALDAAEAALATAKAQLATARTTLATVQAERTLASPVPARVATIAAAPGTTLPAGAAVLTLVPDTALWLRAEWFGSAAPPPRTTARFVPADGSRAIPVRLTAALPVRARDGARLLNFAAASSVTWQAGETGNLIWQAPVQNAVAVPAEALVLNAGRWYVLTDVNGKLAPQAVTPGPDRGTDVLITRGLRAGTPVVVREAYLLFHRDFSAQFEPAD